ncbi:hypothetical protein ASE00_09605 [Sphingomonas sp. Root710]|uniref:TetR/AcrR family transcriptional regulator n=1 Tax=Sphingomonas sp. Root710 TaxID=1736594 RepID=UPI0006FC660F|nr:TetR family transcriptional regulator [Sphingomonas sp. Root710]KRB83058.1 hypothetical protein ASE00_09605 [Sphingomonas sp. Root710]
MSDTQTSLEPNFRAQILDAASAQVRRFGEAKTNVVDIARALGTSHTTIYRHFRSKAEIFDALVLELMRDEEELAATYLNSSAPVAERLLAMFLDLHRRKRERFVGDREIHDLHRRILVERLDMVSSYVQRMTALLTKIIAQAVERDEWKVDDIATAASVIRDAMTVYVHPAFIADLVKQEAPVEDMIRAAILTLSRAFEAGVIYA